MKKHYLGLFGLIFIGLSIILIPVKASAQSTLQATGGSLQQQTGQAQATTNQLNQTGSVQTNTNNGGEEFLNQSPVRPLGVVSDPRKTTPEAIVAPSENLKTEVPKEDGPNLLVRSVVVLLIVGVIGFIYLWTRERKPVQQVAPEPEEEIIRPETIVKKPKKDKRSRKKRKKPNQR